MAARRDRHWLGFVLLGGLAVVCLISNFLIWWIFTQSMVVQPSGFPFVIDLYLLSQVACGVIFVQPALLSIYLAYGKHQTIVRVLLVAVAIALAYAALAVGWILSHDSSNRFFMRSFEATNMTLFWGAQAISFSLAMWFSRIMRGWELSTKESSVGPDERPIRRQETIIETVVLSFLTIAVIFGPDKLISHAEPGIGALFFAIIGLIGTVVIAPIVFVSLRFRSAIMIGAALLLLLIALPAVIVGLMLAISPGSETLAELLREGPIVAMLAASGMLSAFLLAIRLAGFRLQQRHFPKKETSRVAIDPLAD